jgi:hypothetical protein
LYAGFLIEHSAPGCGSRHLPVLRRRSEPRQRSGESVQRLHARQRYGCIETSGGAAGFAPSSSSMRRFSSSMPLASCTSRLDAELVQRYPAIPWGKIYGMKNFATARGWQHFEDAVPARKLDLGTGFWVNKILAPQ